MNEQRRLGCSGEKLRGLGSALFLYSVTSAEWEREEARQSAKYMVLVFCISYYKHSDQICFY